jgi:DNA replication and repair protein RecF
LDDIFDKLDNERVEKLIRLVTADYFGQVIVTDTDDRRMTELFESLNIEKKLFQVEKSEITEIKL